MIWWRWGVLILISLSALWMAASDPFYRLIRNPQEWLVRSWTETIVISLLIMIISIILIPNVRLLIERVVQHQLVDREAHMQTMIIAISPLLMLGIRIMVVFVEEIIFRLGFLEFFKRKQGTVVGLLLSSLAFALYHLIDPAYSFLFIIPATVAGLMFGVAYLMTGLVGSFLTHAGYNVVVLMLHV